MSVSGDVVVEAVLQTYNALPRKYKPVEATADFFQWVPLSGIVVVKGTSPCSGDILYDLKSL